MTHANDTFSSFEPWDSKPPEQHVEDVLDLLAEYAAQRALDRAREAVR